MLVETFEAIETELAERAPEMEDEALGLIETLGLTGQQALVKPDEAGVATRIPYREMTAEEDRVYSVLCPDVVDVAAYQAGPIPLRVLQVVAHARPLFDEVLVWYSGSVVVKDPVLVGYEGNRWNGKKFMLARWGEELGDLGELRAAAMVKWLAKEKAKAEAKIGECQAFVAGLAEREAVRYFDGEFVNTPA